MALAFATVGALPTLFEDFRFFVKADPQPTRARLSAVLNPPIPAPAITACGGFIAAIAAAIRAQPQAPPKIRIAAWLENTFGWFAASVQYLVINIMGRAIWQIASLSAPISMKICGWSKGGKAPTHMNSLAPTRTSGTPAGCENAECCARP